MEKQSISRTLAHFIAGAAYGDLPGEVQNRARNLLLDALGIAIAARELPSPRIALESLTDRQGSSTIFNFKLKASAPDAAFVNAVQVCSTAHEDVLFKTHPGVVVIPTALAVAEQENSTGAEVLTALVIGYDVIGRIFLGESSIAPGFRNMSVFGPFGAAATAGKLLRLNENQMVSALGFAANLASGLMECWLAGTMEGNFHGGICARNGINAAILARAGATAAEQSLEGKQGFYRAYTGTAGKPEAATADIGKRFLIMEAVYKPYPACFGQQIPIQSLLLLSRQNHIKAADVVEVVEKMALSHASFPGTDYAGPFTSTQSVLSAQFCGAAALLGRPVHSYKLYTYQYGDPEIAALARKIKVVGEEKREGLRIEVTCRDGQTYAIEGEAEETLIPADEVIRAKFRSITSDIIGRKPADEIIDVVDNLDKCRDIRELTRLL